MQFQTFLSHCCFSCLTSVSKHQDGGMYKTPAYPGYPFLMLPDPYLPNSSVSPSVSAPLFEFSCWLFVSCWVLAEGSRRSLSPPVCILLWTPVQVLALQLLFVFFGVNSKHWKHGFVHQQVFNAMSFLIISSVTCTHDASWLVFLTFGCSK